MDASGRDKGQAEGMEPEQGTDQLTAEQENYAFSISGPIRQIGPLSAAAAFLEFDFPPSPPLFSVGRGADQREVGMNSVGRPNGFIFPSIRFLPHGSALKLKLILVKIPIKVFKVQSRLCHGSQSSNLAALKPLCVVTLLVGPVTFPARRRFNYPVYSLVLLQLHHHVVVGILILLPLVHLW